MLGLVVAALAGVLAGPPTLPPDPPQAGLAPAERAPAELRGQVLASGFELDLGQVVIELDRPDFAQPRRLRVDLRGEFMFVGLTPGRYLARARHGDRVVELPVELRPGEQRAIVLRFGPPTPLPPPPALPPRPAGAIHDRPQNEGAALRRFGLAATITGVILGVGGLIAAYADPCGHDGATGSDCKVDVRNTVALVMGVAGFGLVSGGITSMAIGQSYRRQAQLEAGLALSIEREGGGLVLRGRF